MKNSLTEIKNQVAQRHGYKNWNDAYVDMNFKQHNDFMADVALEYAKQCKEAQRESDANIQTWGMVYKEYKEDLKHAILNNPLVTYKIY